MNTETYVGVRCPYCLRNIRLNEEYLSSEEVSCTGCGRDFECGEGLPYVSDATRARLREKAALEEEEARREEQEANRRTWICGLLFGLPVIAVLAFLTAWLTHDVRGPTFLVVYAVFFGIALLGSIVTRCAWVDSLVFRILGFLAFELLGVLRLLTFSGTKFGYLYLSMFIGGIIFFLRAEWFSSSDGGGGGFFVFGGGGCGGGCGGGGCGGCGGF